MAELAIVGRNFASKESEEAPADPIFFSPLRAKVLVNADVRKRKLDIPEASKESRKVLQNQTMLRGIAET